MEHIKRIIAVFFILLTTVMMLILLFAAVSAAEQKEDSQQWLVTWTVTNSWIVPCPEWEPVESIDEYGRKHTMFSFQIALACLDSASTPMNKHFNSYQEAEKFVNKGRYNGDIMNELSDFKIMKLYNVTFDTNE